MATQPTIIIGSLNDAELKQSIDKLVEHVNTATKTMVTNFDQAINDMKRKLQELGNTNVNMGGTADGGSSRRASSQAKEKQAVQETTLTYDQQAQTLQKVVNQQQNYSAEIRKAADAIRQSTSWQENGIDHVGRAVVYKKDELSIEEQLVQAQKKYGDEILKNTSNIESQTASVRQFGGEMKAANDNAINMHQQTMRSRAIMAQGPMAGVVQSYDDLRQMVANVLGIEREEVAFSDTKHASMVALNADLKQMNDAYAKLSETQRNSDQGKELAQNIQITSRELQKINQEKMRPQSLQQAMGLSENSLDDIAYKVKQLQLYQRGLDVSNKQGEQEFRAVGKAISDLSVRQDKLMRGQRGLIQTNNALTRSFNYMKNRLAFMFTVGGTTQFVKQLAEVRGEYEMTERALGVLVDSAERGTKIFQELSQMALVSPYTLIELSNAAKQLVAYDVAAKDVVDTTRRLADISAAVGAPVERLTYALGQIKAYEYLNSRDARIFANAGIPLVKQLSQYYTELEGRLVSVGDVYDRIKKKAVSYNDVMGVLTRMTDEGGRFFDFQAKVADTLKVQLANLTLAWNNMLNDIGKEQGGLLTGSIKMLKQVFMAWKNINSALKTLIWTFGIYKGIQLLVITFQERITSERIKEIFITDKLAASYGRLSASMKNVTASGGTMIGAIIAVLSSLVLHLRQMREETLAFNKTIADGAKEASKALSDFLDNADNAVIKVQALNKQLSPEEGEKAWEMIRDEIEGSSAASAELIPDLLKIEDINQRVSAAFDMAERIREAQVEISNLFDEFEVHDMWRPKWLGIFGDRGFEQDVQRWDKIIKIDKQVQRQEEERRQLFEKEFPYMDYKPYGRWTNKEWARQEGETAEQFKRRIEIMQSYFDEEQKLLTKRSWLDNYDFSKNFVGDEAIKEIEKLASDAAHVMKEKLGEGITDGVKVSEAIQRFYNALYEKYPNFSKEMRENIEWYSLQTFAKEFDVFSLSAIAENKFFELLKKNAKGAFTDISDDIRDEEGLWYNDAQKKAIDNTLKEMSPEWAALLTQALSEDINSTEWRMSILAHFDIENRDAIQRAFDRIFHQELNDSVQRGIFTPLRRKAGESDLEWEKRLADAEKDYLERIEQGNYMLEQETDKQGDVYKAREKNLELDKQSLEAIKRVQQEFRLRSKEELDATNKANKGEDELSQVIKKEIQLVTDIQKRYKDYRSMGMDSTDALNLAAKEYNRTLQEVESTLKRLGVSTISNQDMMEKTPTEIRDFYTQQIKDIQRVSTAVKGFNSYMEKNLNLSYDVEENFYKATRALVTRNEGFSSTAYHLDGEYWDKEKKNPKYTIGYGFTSLITRGWEKVTADTTITAEEAEKEIEAQLKYRLNKIRKLFEVYAPNIQLTPQQIMSYLDLAFQSGGGPEAILRASEGNLDKIGQMLATAAYDRLNDEQRKTMGRGVLSRDKMRQQAWVSDIGSESAKPLAEAFDSIMLNFDEQVDATVTAMKEMIKDGGGAFAEIQALVDAGKAPEAIEALEKAIAALNVEIAQTDYKDRAEHFRSAIDALKDGYEFAKEMKDNPSLGHIFADMLGLSDDDLNELPKDAEDVMIKIQRLLIEKYNRGVDIKSVLNATDLQQWFTEQGIDPNGEFGKQIESAVKMINDLRLNEAKTQIDDWNKLLEKYAEYEYKRTEIIKQAEREREAARKNGATQDVFNAIDKGERRQLASLDFEQFQKSNLWLTATGDLATLTNGALRGLIDALDEYKNKAQDLDPKEIKSINSALRKMHKELRKGNPFVAIMEAIDDARERAADFQDEITETQLKMTELWQKISSGQGTKEDLAMLDTLADKLAYLQKVATEAGKVSPTALVSGINDAIGVARTATNEFKELATALGGKGMTDAAENLEHTMNIIESAGQGAAIGAQFGGGWGALIGAVAGGLKGVIVEFADEWSGNKGITEAIEKSRREVTLLGQTYNQLAWEADKAYGVMASGLRGVTAENKKLQLAELERQLVLEQSRKAKNKDEDEIIRLKGEIADLRREITDTTHDAINQLLGISDWGGQIESLIQVMIDAFRNGEDAMQAFSDKWDEMVDNIILKLIVSKFVEQAWDEISQTIDRKRAEMTQQAEADKAKNEQIQNDTKAAWEQWLKDTGNTWNALDYESNQALFDEFSKNYETWLAQREKDNEDAFKQSEIDFAEWLKEYLQGDAKDSMMNELGPVMDAIKDVYSFGDKGNKQLSLLQQGIQGITEETAGALEAYMNGVSQQVYLHSSILSQIRDAIVTPESGIEEQLDLMRQAAGLSEDEAVKSDLQMGVMSQMLLQLQASYQMQGAIYSMLNGWSNADGQSVRVTMIS